MNERKKNKRGSEISDKLSRKTQRNCVGKRRSFQRECKGISRLFCFSRLRHLPFLLTLLHLFQFIAPLAFLYVPNSTNYSLAS